jgi:hypothetical protein
MGRGVLAADVEQRDRLLALLSRASSIEMTLLSGGTCSLETTGLAQTGPGLIRCLADLETCGSLR